MISSMKKIITLLSLIALSCNTKNTPETSFDFETIFEKSNGTETATYDQVITYYKALAANHSSIIVEEIGTTDSGEPLHLVWYNHEGNFSNNENITLLINNGIHPGESDGIDATMMLYRDLAQKKIKTPENVCIATIPVYNVGGSLNRNTGTRTNQNGPKAYGFRGNSRNYDLNRDFIKSDTKNAKTFAKIFHKTDPDIFIDNHVSNGADYQYTLTHLFTQHNKLDGKLGDYLHKKLMPGLEQSLQKKQLDITPYVNVWGTTPEAGWSQFMDHPRYSTGYTTLFNTLGMMVETHMLKPYNDRVEQTYALMESMITLADTDYQNILTIRADHINEQVQKKEYPLTWEVDSTQVTQLNFKGYEGTYIESKVTGKKRLFYDKSKPYTKAVSYYNYMKPKIHKTIPKAYIIPQQWFNVIELLQLNEVPLARIQNDTIINAEVSKIVAYETRKSAYEGHYLHYNTTTNSYPEGVSLRKGDYIAKVSPKSIRYLMEVLEPEAPDSFFNWNFFDTILQQKEHFSPYVFEDKAYEILQNDHLLRKEFEAKKKSDNTFAENWYAQLDWVHKHSNHYESAHLRYPIYKILY